MGIGTSGYITSAHSTVSSLPQSITTSGNHIINAPSLQGIVYNYEPIKHPKKVIYNPPRTIVIWGDGTKTIVKCSDDAEFSEYYGFCAAVAKKMFGSSSAVSRAAGIPKEKKEKEMKEPEAKAESEPVEDTKYHVGDIVKVRGDISKIAVSADGVFILPCMKALAGRFVTIRRIEWLSCREARYEVEGLTAIYWSGDLFECKVKIKKEEVYAVGDKVVVVDTFPEQQGTTDLMYNDEMKEYRGKEVTICETGYSYRIGQFYTISEDRIAWRWPHNFFKGRVIERQ